MRFINAIADRMLEKAVPKMSAGASCTYEYGLGAYCYCSGTIAYYKSWERLYDCQVVWYPCGPTYLTC